MNYKAYTLRNYREIKQLNQVPEEKLKALEIVSRVLPFKTNNYIVNELINWNDPFNDPLFKLTFPQKDMLSEYHFDTINELILKNAGEYLINHKINEIRQQLNPHPAGQLEYNMPEFEGQTLNGIQHKYNETMLFFPSHGQTCHAYCTFCFRWPQFTGISDLKLAMKDTNLMVRYLKANKEITDILFTGGDPMIMSAKLLERYINPLLNEDIPNLQTIRIGSKSLTFWPYRYLTDPDSDDVLRLFEKIVKSGKHLAFMAHFNHFGELNTEACVKAIKRIKNTGAEIRSQAPILNHINANPNIWIKLWKKQVNLGIIPYYMFIPRNTGSQEYFNVPLVKAYDIFSKAYSNVSGIARTVRGPSMSTNPGKILILGCPEINGEKVIALSFIQGRDADWVLKPFFAKYNENAKWIDELKPAFQEEEDFFYVNEFYDLIE